MKTQVKKRKIALATAAALLIAGCSSDAASPSNDAVESDMGQCRGVNSCKGTGSCATKGQNHCAGQNACKGKAWVPLNKADCKSRGGKFAGFMKNS